MNPTAPPGSGYVFAIADGSGFYIPGALHVERDDELFLFADDEEHPNAADLEGFPLAVSYKHNGAPDPAAYGVCRMVV